MSSRTKDMLISQTDRNYCMKICVDIKHQVKKVILIAILADFEDSRLIFCLPCLIKKTESVKGKCASKQVRAV